MSNQSDITTFQFLEVVQNKFVKGHSGEGESKPYSTRRLIDFLNDSAKLHVVAASDEGLNGHADPIALVTMENVAQKGEPSTFAINVSVRPFEKTQKHLSITGNKDALEKETDKLITVLTNALANAPAEDAPQEEADTAPEGRRSERRSRGDDESGDSSSRIRRRSLRRSES